MAKSIKKNFIYNLIYQLLLIIAPLVLTPYISRVIGVVGVGEYSYASSIVAYFTLFAVFGTALYGQRTIGYNQQNIEERSRTFWELFTFRVISGITTLALYVAYIAIFVDKSQFVISAILMLSIVNVILDISWFFQGMEEFSKTATISIVFKIIDIVSAFIFVKTSTDLWKYVLISVSCSVLGNIALWCFLPKYICKVKGIKLFRDIKSIVLLFLPTIATQIYTVLDKSMIGWISNSFEENGYYEQAEKIVKMTVTIVTALGAVMIPRIAQCYKSDNHEQVKYYLYKSYRFVWMMAIPIMLGAIFIADYLVPVFFGPGYEKCSTLIMIMSPLTIAMGLGHVTGLQYFVPTGKQNMLTITYIIGAIVNVILNLILIPFFASVGAAIATIIAEMMVATAGLIYVKVKKLYAIMPIFKCSIKFWIAGIVMAGSIFVIKMFIPVSVWALIVLIAAGMIIYFLVLLILREALLMELISNAFKLLHKRKLKNEDLEVEEEESEKINDNVEDDINIVE